MARTDTCAFCGYEGTSFDPEHWIPRWLSRELIPGLASGVIHNMPGLPSWEAKLFEIDLSGAWAPSEHRPTHDWSVCRNFKASGVPPYPNYSLALGYRQIEETSPIWVWWGSQGLRFTSGQSGVPSIDGYRTTILIGYLVADAIGAALRVEVDIQHQDGFHVLWPLARTGGTFSWPPEKRFTGIKDNELI